MFFSLRVRTILRPNDTVPTWVRIASSVLGSITRTMSEALHAGDDGAASDQFVFCQACTLEAMRTQGLSGGPSYENDCASICNFPHLRRVHLVRRFPTSTKQGGQSRLSNRQNQSPDRRDAD